MGFMARENGTGMVIENWMAFFIYGFTVSIYNLLSCGGDGDRFFWHTKHIAK